MWTCKHCAEQLEDSFDDCWNCGYARDGTPPEGGKANEAWDNKKEPRFAQPGTASPLPPERHEVVVVDVSMPFWSMVVFMVKLAIASIPAGMILFTLAFSVYAIFWGLGAVIFHFR